jgi:violaxanthin de-epoxidase
MKMSSKINAKSNINMRSDTLNFSKFKTSLLSLGLVALTSFAPMTSMAADTAAVGKCLLTSCQKELAQCVLNPKCLANVVCLNACNDRPDEGECQIRCGDLFENDVVGVFNACAVSQKKCVPQKQTPSLYPLPAKESMVKKFDSKFWEGRWYISAGLM